jgi:hypothetical protein
LDDITREAWAIVADHMTRGQKDPTLMVADGIRLERARRGGTDADDTAGLPGTADTAPMDRPTSQSAHQGKHGQSVIAANGASA